MLHEELEAALPELKERFDCVEYDFDVLRTLVEAQERCVHDNEIAAFSESVLAMLGALSAQLEDLKTIYERDFS